MDVFNLLKSFSFNFFFKFKSSRVRIIDVKMRRKSKKKFRATENPGLLVFITKKIATLKMEHEMTKVNFLFAS